VVELETDTGAVGFAVNGGGGNYACALIETHLKRFVIGQDPFNIERIWDQLYRASVMYGRGGIHGMAIAAIDLALWDLIGKITSQPVFNLLGGRMSDAIPCYVTVLPSKVPHIANKGFSGVKLVMTKGPQDGPAALDEIEQVVGDARDALGTGVDLMIECFMGWGAEFTRRAAARLRRFDIKWIEDPMMPGLAGDQYSSLKNDIRPIQLALGNMEFDLPKFGELLGTCACDVIQPEIQWIGGITPARAISGAARLAGILISPHCSSVYSYHFAASLPQCGPAEFLLRGSGHEIVPLFTALEDEPIPVDGQLHLNRSPGFGVSLNRSILLPYTS
jgi:L-rhamnonate dehydratase